MKLAVLSGAYKNAGDFLIVDRTKKLIEDIYPGVEFITYQRNKSLDPYLSEINSCSALIMAGGPAYLYDAYPNQIPLATNLNDIKVPVYGVGMGWCGKNSLEDTIRRYRFSDSTRQLLLRLSSHSTLSCRDYYTVRVLELNGYTAHMTGCPAWYDLENAEKTELRQGIKIPYKKICISDPAYVHNTNSAFELVKAVKMRYPDAEIVFVFHRGIKADEWTSSEMGRKYTQLCEQLKGENIRIEDIAFSEKGFSVYDDCDLHIGFRVHAHIYNLSKRNISVLIEEDGRGAGVNQALGQIPLPAYDLMKAYSLSGTSIIKKGRRYINAKIGTNVNKNLVPTAMSILSALETNDYNMILSAYATMVQYYHVMRKYIEDFSLVE